MADGNDILKEVREIFKTKWDRREGKQVPDTEDVGLANDSVVLEGTILYADLVDSTGLVAGFKDWFAAEMYKSYLVSACRIIRENGGEITAFDGDRVMAVFIGGAKNSSAAEAALKINYAVQYLINPAIKEAYPQTAYRLKQAIGIDTGQLLVARTGIRGSNDLVWVGRAANYAAKLCSLRDENNATFITESVFKKLRDNAKNGGQPKRCMWEKDAWPETGTTIYKSSWWWKF